MQLALFPPLAQVGHSHLRTDATLATLSLWICCYTQNDKHILAGIKYLKTQ